MLQLSDVYWLGKCTVTNENKVSSHQCIAFLPFQWEQIPNLFSINQPATIKVATISSVFTPVISAHGRVFNRFICRWEDVSYRFSPWNLQSLRSVYHETSSSVHQCLILHYIICICFNCYFIRTLTMLSLSLSLSPPSSSFFSAFASLFIGTIIIEIMYF